MKAERNKVFVKRGSEMQSVDVADLVVDGVRLGDVIAKLHSDNKKLIEQNKKLIETLENSIIIERDKSYLIQVGEHVKSVKNPAVIEYQELTFPIFAYEIKDGKLILNKERLSIL